MNENLYELFDDVILSDFSMNIEGNKAIIELGDDGKYGKMENYSLFPGIIISFIDMEIENMEEVFFDGNINFRLLEINHCCDGRYAYRVGDEKIVYFGKGDLCISVSDITKSLSDFPLGVYRGLEIFIDIDVVNEYIKEYIPNFDLIEFYEKLKQNNGYYLLRSNEKIDHVIGELYSVDERIKEPYFKLKCIELLLFFSITNFTIDNSPTLSKKQVDMVDMVKQDLINDLESKITIDDLAIKYGVSKTTLKNCFKEVYGKPIIRWRKEYKLDYACKLIEKGEYSISEISEIVGYSSPSKFGQAFKDYVGCTPSDYVK